MFEKSYFQELQDYIEAGCNYQLTPNEQAYYNALYAVVGIHRKYGKDRAISLLMREPFNCTRQRARTMYNEAINLFFCDDSVEPQAHRNMIFDNLMKAAQAVLLSATTSKDLEVYGNLQMQAWKVKRLDQEDPVKREKVKNKDIKVYTLDADKIGIPAIDRTLLAAQIDSIPNINERDRVRLKQDAGAVDFDFEEMLDDTQEKTESYR